MSQMHPPSLYLTIRQQMDRVLQDVRLGKALEPKNMRSVLEQLLDAILHDNKNLTFLARLQDHQNALVTKSVNVTVFTLVFAKHLGLRRDQLIPLGLGALLHPLGLLQVPSKILSKSTPLSKEERDLIHQYPQQGYELLASQGGFDHQVLDIVLHHQERVKGTGYPEQLQGREISFLARMVAITSVYEALTRNRNYRQALNPAQALGLLYRWRYRDFDQRLVEKFIQSLGVYPPGCLVELSDASLAVVHATQVEPKSAPLVKRLTNANLEPLPQEELLDLTTAELSICKVVDPSAPKLEVLLNELARKSPDFPV